MSSTYDINNEEMAGYLHQGMLLGHLMLESVKAEPVFVDGTRNYTPDKLVVKIPHPTKENTTLVYTLITESVVEE